MALGYPYSYNPYDLEKSQVTEDLNEKIYSYIALTQCKKRIKRVLRKRNVSQLRQKIMKYLKYSLICFVATQKNPADPSNEQEELITLFRVLVQKTTDLFLQIVITIVKSVQIILIKPLITFIMNHPNLSFFFCYSCMSLLVLDRILKKTKKELKVYHYLFLAILVLILMSLLGFVIQSEYYETICEAIYGGFITIGRALVNAQKKICDQIAEESKISKLENNLLAKSDLPSNKKPLDGKQIVIYSTLVALFTKYLITRGKRELVGNGPFADEIIITVEKINNFFDKKDRKLKL